MDVTTSPVDRRGRWRNGNVAGLERLGSVATGTIAIAYALSRRSRARTWLTAAGTTLVYRGVTGHCPVYSTLGVTTAGNEDTRLALAGDRGINVHEAVTLERPIEEVYAFWRRFENLPRFMTYLERVDDLGNGRTHWVAKGPLGTTVEWHAEIINEVENQVIGWRSLPGSEVTMAGSVNFDRVRNGRATRVLVRLQYAPAAGRAGALLARLFGREPSQTIREDLRRFKQLLEAGEVPVAQALKVSHV
ncbi:MAG: SRPBCC family protein [Vicinamibacterales bacterium]